MIVLGVVAAVVCGGIVVAAVFVIRRRYTIFCR